MAIYHFSAKVISRAAGSSAVAAAAYRSADRLHDERLGRSHDFSNKAGVVHSEVMLPEGANERWSDRESLWNDVEAAELRKDAQLAREIEFAIPREMTEGQGIELARDFVQREFVDRGMIADLNVHWDIGADGLARPHAHVMLTMREIRIDEDGSAEFGAKVRDWNRAELLTHWREAWADHVNERLAALDIDARVDHRTLEAQGIDLEPQHKIGPAASRMAADGLEADRHAEHIEIARSNGEKIIADPGIALDAITHRQATFTNRDLAMFAHRHSDGKDQFDAVMAAVKSSPDLIALGKDGRGENRFTSRAMIRAEERLERATATLDARRNHGVADRHRELALEHARQNERDLGVKNGSLGTVQSASPMRMAVVLDDGRSVAFDVKDYAHVDHGYAATIHKAQGMTVDRVQVLATPGVDSHSTYVALSRHRERVNLYYGRDDFANQNKLVRAASRERGKDMASDYRVQDTAKATEPKRSIFAGLKLKRSVSVEALGKGPEQKREAAPRKLHVSARALDAGSERGTLDRAVERYARAQRNIDAMHAKGLSPIGHQRNALESAARDLDAQQVSGSKDLSAAFQRDPALVDDAANGRAQRAIAAMRAERAYRLDAPARADRFVAEWQARSEELRHHKANHDYAGSKHVGAQLNDMAKALHRDPQLESLLRNRTHELGLKRLESNSVSHALQEHLRPSRSLGIGL